jgi:hypothetical protein
MATKKTKRASKRVKTLPAKRLTAKQAKGVKGGTQGVWKLSWRPS